MLQDDLIMTAHGHCKGQQDSGVPMQQPSTRICVDERIKHYRRHRDCCSSQDTKRDFARAVAKQIQLAVFAQISQVTNGGAH